MKKQPLLTFPPLCFLGAAALFALGSAATAQEAPLQIGFSFNEGAAAGGDTLTDYYGNHNGTYVGGWSVDGDASHYFTDGFSGETGDYAVFFAGNRATVDLDAALGGAWDSFTFEVNLFLTGETANWARALHMLGGPSLVQRRGGLDSLRIGGAVDDIDVDAPADEWFHVAWVYDAGTDEVRVYIDGEQRGNGALDPDMASPGTLVIGATDVGGSPWGTPLDDVRFTHAALSPEEFLLEGFGPELRAGDDPPPAEPSIQVGLSFNEGQAGGGSPVTDFYGNQDGTYVGNWVIDENPAHFFREGFSGEPGDYAPVFEGNRVTVELGDLLGGSWESFTFEANLHMTAETSNWGRALHALGGPSFVQRRGTLNQLRFSGMDPEVDASVPADEWFHVAWVYDADADQVRVYVNGENRGSGSLDPQLASPITLVVGTTDVGGSPWGTRIDDVRFSDVALAPGQFLPEGFGAHLTDPEVGELFDAWRAEHFSQEELEDESISGPEAAPAGDGIPNLLKYALGLGNPKAPARHLLPQPDVVVGELQLTFPRALSAEDVELFAEFSEDLQTWESGEDVVEIVGTVEDGDIEWVTVRVIAPVADLDRAFLRLQSLLEP